MLTRGNRQPEWLHYEAGAMAEGVGIRVAPYLIGVPLDQLSGPLKRLQAKHADLNETTDLVLSMGEAIVTASKEVVIRSAVKQYWGDLQKKIDNAPSDDAASVLLAAWGIPKSASGTVPIAEQPTVFLTVPFVPPIQGHCPQDADLSRLLHD